MERLHELFRLDGRVGRSQYLAVGVSLALVKYAVDAGIYFLLTGLFWDPLTYLDPVFAVRMSEVEDLSTGYLAFLVVWTLPFMWIGVVMSARRAGDAGFSPWLGLAFLVPLVSYLAIVVLALLPSRDVEPRRLRTTEFSFRTLIHGVAFIVILGTGLIALLTLGLHYYGAALFLGVPFVWGTAASFLYNLPRERGFWQSVGFVSLVLLAGFLVLLAFALEGLVCLAMAYPVMWAAAVPGALFGRALARRSLMPDLTLGLVVLALPLGAGAEQRLVEQGQREVSTSIEVDAAPEVVWEHVVAFNELPPPEHWLFQTGLAYPLRAHIDGRGVGAVRRCEFTTGAFVEPITLWDEPRRLGFDVVEQPVPMQEWSFYAHVHPPHLDESFRSVRGEFRLTPTENGGTLLEGSTWYVIDMGPPAYWMLWSDAILHRIHMRVLKHVRSLSEAQAGR